MTTKGISWSTNFNDKTFVNGDGKLIEKLLPRYNFCNVKYDNNKRFGLFYEDELYYEQMQKKASNTLYYLSAWHEIF